MSRKEEWIDISYTVKASQLRGNKLMRNVLNGDEVVVDENDQLHLDLDEVVKHFPKKKAPGKGRVKK